MTTSTVIHDLKTLILSFHPVIAIETVEEDRVGALIGKVSDELSIPVFDWSITQGLIKLPGNTMIHGTDDALGVLTHMEDLTVDAVFHLKDLATHLANNSVSRKFREVAQLFSRRVSTIVMTGHDVGVAADLEHKVVHYELELPSLDEIRAAVGPVVQSLMASRGVDFSLSPDEFEEFLRSLSGMTLNEARQMVAFAALEDGKLSADDIGHVIERKVQVIKDGGLLEYYPAEDNTYEIGGFQRLKSWLERARVGFTPEAKLLNLHPPRGIFIVGVQGCGKSLAAKSIAREWRLPLLKLDAGRLFDKYIGESEKNFRKAVSMAESMAPAVLWIDEIEKAMPTSGGSDQDGGLSRRLFGAFLTWLQEKTFPVFVVATANDLTHTPPELLRKGRFDEIFFVDLPDAEERTRIFDIHLRLRRQDPGAFDMDRLAGATDGFSGAEIEQVVIASLYRALHLRHPLDANLILAEVSETIPLSVSRAEDINHLRAVARDRFVSVH